MMKPKNREVTYLLKVAQQVRGRAGILIGDFWIPESGSFPQCYPHRRLWDERWDFDQPGKAR